MELVVPARNFLHQPVACITSKKAWMLISNCEKAAQCLPIELVKSVERYNKALQRAWKNNTLGIL